MRTLPEEVRKQEKFAVLVFRVPLASKPVTLTADGVGKEVRSWLFHRSQEQKLVPIGELTVEQKSTMGEQGSGAVTVSYEVKVNGSQPVTVENALQDLHGFLRDKWRSISSPRISFREQ